MTRNLTTRPEDVPALRREIHQWLSENGQQFYADMIKIGLQPVRPAGPRHVVARQLAESEMYRLANADLWYIGRDLCDLVGKACTTMPRFAPKPYDLPSRCGFAVFADPIHERDPRDGLGLPEDLAELATEDTICIKAVSWGPVYMPDQMERAPSGAVWMSFYAQFKSGNHRGLPPICVDNEAVIPWHPDGQPETDWLLPEPGSNETTYGWASTVFATFRLAAQEGLTEQETHTTQRPERRRTERDGLPVKDVRIARLRASVATTPGAEGGTGREYQHRWIVRGHWRQQPYGPGRQDRRPVWIMPHIKGPDDAPLIGGDRVTVVDTSRTKLDK